MALRGIYNQGVSYMFFGVTPREIHLPWSQETLASAAGKKILVCSEHFYSEDWLHKNTPLLEIVPLGMYRIPHNYFYIFVYNLVSSDWQGPYLRGGIPSQSLHWQGRWKKINRSMPFWKAHVDFQKKKLTSPRLLSRRNEGEFGF